MIIPPKTFENFLRYLQEAAKPQEVTGHLDHVTHLYADPQATFKHFTNTVNHFEGKKAAGTISQKADGGMSVVVGNHNGKVFVKYKSPGARKHFSHESIATEPKEHMRRMLGHFLTHAQTMPIQKNTAFQGDLLHQSDAPSSKKTVEKPNTIGYDIPKGHTTSIAAHSQYSVDKDGEMKKTSNAPDVSQLRGSGVYAPELAMGKNLKLGMHPNRSKKIHELVTDAKSQMTPELAKFGKTLHTGAGHHPKFSAFHEQYHSHSSRTSGSRSVAEMRAYVDNFTNKKAQQPGGGKPKKGESSAEHKMRLSAHKAELSQALHANIDKHEEKFHKLFGIHNQLISAKHHILDQMREHEGQFELQTHAGEEHEGLVSSITTPGKKEHMAKFVREGPTGFPKKNNDNPRFAKET